MKPYPEILKGENCNVTELLNFYRDHEENYSDIDYEFYRKLYSDNFLNEIVTELKIYRNEDLAQMCFYIMIAADAYESAIRLNENKFRQNDYVSAIKKIKTGFQKSYTELDSFVDLEKDQYWFAVNFFASFKEQFEKSCIEIENAILPDNPFAQALNSKTPLIYEHFVDFLEILINTCDNQITSPQVQTPNYKAPLEKWMGEIAVGLEEYSTLSLITGKYYSKEIGYVSDAMAVLEKIIKPLDDNISNIQIGNALRSWKEKQKRVTKQLQKINSDL